MLVKFKLMWPVTALMSFSLAYQTFSETKIIKKNLVSERRNGEDFTFSCWRSGDKSLYTFHRYIVDDIMELNRLRRLFVP